MSSYFDFHCKQLEISARRDAEQIECIKGTCYQMCPEEEAKLREKVNMVHVLEVVGPTRKLVKSYSRSAADTNIAVPKLLRPYMVLHDTVQYLILEVTKRTDVPGSVVYDFVTDRLRAVRQDMTVQRMTSEQCINLLEPMIRFHVYYGYKLQDYPLKDYDPVLNKKYLLECLKWFLSCYNTIDQRQSSQNGSVEKLSDSLSNLNFRENVSCNRILMESLYILCNLEDVHPLLRYLNLPKDLKREPILNKSYKIAVAYLKGNYLRVCRLMDELCPLTYCALCTHLPTIQRKALLVMSHAYNSKRLSVPMELLSRWLRFASAREAWHACKHYGLSADRDAVTFDKGQFRSDVPLHQANTQHLKNNLDLSIDNIFTYKPS